MHIPPWPHCGATTLFLLDNLEKSPRQPILCWTPFFAGQFKTVTSPKWQCGCVSFQRGGIIVVSTFALGNWNSIPGYPEIQRCTEKKIFLVAYWEWSWEGSLQLLVFDSTDQSLQILCSGFGRDRTTCWFQACTPICRTAPWTHRERCPIAVCDWVLSRHHMVSAGTSGWWSVWCYLWKGRHPLLLYYAEVASLVRRSVEWEDRVIVFQTFWRLYSLWTWWHWHCG